MVSVSIPMKSSDPHSLLRLIQTKFILPSGLLSRHFPPGKRSLFDNFDDLVPFFLYYKQADFLLQQIRLIRQQQESFLSLCVEDGVLHSSLVDEWFGGLYSIWKETKDPETFSLLKNSVELVQQKLIQADFLAGAYYPDSDSCSDFYESWSAGLLESFCEMREEFPEAFLSAQKILRAWLKDDYYKTYGLFPYRVHSSKGKQWWQKNVLGKFPPTHRHTKALGTNKDHKRNLLSYTAQKVRFAFTSGYYSQLMKSNSTPAFALLEFYRATGEKFWLEHLEAWIEKALLHFCEKDSLGKNTGRVWGEFHPLASISQRDSGIVPAFILCDVLCDSAAFVPDLRKHLPNVKTILDFYWSKRLKNGLIPQTEIAQFSHLDPQIDFSISLRRFAELTQDSAYLEKSIQLLEAALREHYSENGYLTYSGKVDTNTIDPKYNALVLKGLIHLETKNQSLYENMHSLFKDR